MDTIALQRPNAVQFPSGGVNALRYAPDGSLHQLLEIAKGENASDLVFLRRNAFGDWSRETIASAEGSFSGPPGRARPS